MTEKADNSHLYLLLLVSLLIHAAVIGMVGLPVHHVAGRSVSLELVLVSEKNEVKDRVEKDALQQREVIKKKLNVTEVTQNKPAKSMIVAHQAATASVPQEKIVPASKEIEHAVESQKSVASNKTSGEDRYLFVDLIHREINRHKHYPYIARRQQRQGVVNVNFRLHPDGRVDEVAVVQSSHFGALDRAATDAVQSISPFAMAGEYLKQAESFNVAIEFRLN